MIKEGLLFKVQDLKHPFFRTANVKARVGDRVIADGKLVNITSEEILNNLPEDHMVIIPRIPIHEFTKNKNYPK